MVAARDFRPDELGATYYCRAELGPKFKAETPRWRRNASEPSRELTFSLGRMVNGVGGSVVHYGPGSAAFRPTTCGSARTRWNAGGRKRSPRDAPSPTGLSYDELRPWFDKVERIVGIGGDEDNAFLPHDEPYPLPPTRPFRMGELFTEAARGMGLHPHASPSG